jgi:OOP family OmpA-OmpF porin
LLADFSIDFPTRHFAIFSDWTNTMKRHTSPPRSSLLTIALLAVCASSGVQAQSTFNNTGMYVGISAGESKSKFDNGTTAQSLVGAGVTAGALTEDERGNAYKAFIGVPLSPNWAVEAGYFDLGRFGFGAATSPAGTVTGTTRIQGLNLDLVGTLPITERWSLLGRVGAAYAETKGSFSGTADSGVGAFSSSKRDTHYKYGFGTEYAFTPALTMRLEGERYHVNDAIGQRENVDLISVGLVYRFGAPAQSVRTAYVPPAAQPVYRPEPVVAQAPVATPPPAPVIAPAPVAVQAPAPAPVPKPWVKVKLQADSLFGFDQDSLQADGKQALDKLLQELKDVNVDAVQVTGHTDRLGSAAYNAKLSTRRAEAVRNYLVQVGGMPANLVTATGVGSAQPETSPNDCKGMKASQALITCLRVDRRVEVQVLGSQPQR